MRILHLVGDWKWTGPAEPMLRLLLAQRARGHAVRLACPEAPEGQQGLAERARAAGVEPALALERARGAHPLRDRSDAAKLRSLLVADPADVLHAWHTRDHVLGWRAARSVAAPRPRLVRSYARAERIAAWPWNRWLYGRAGDALILPSAASALSNSSLCRGPVVGVLGAVDLGRFAPGPAVVGTRAGLGLREEHRVVGVVARVQRHRRFDLLLSAMRRLADREPAARLLVVGRGTHLDEVAREPARRLGLSDRVVFAGYRDCDYSEVLRAIDVFSFLVPGSDGSCRALLEAQACGLPAVTSRRGALPEIVRDGETGLLVDEDPERLCEAWLALLEDAPRRERMGRAARAHAERHFSPERLCSDVDAVYGAVV